MQRSELHILALFLFASWLLLSCSSSNTEPDGSEYSVQVSFDTDSTVITDNIYLFADNHNNITIDTTNLDGDRIARFSNYTTGTDELFLMSSNGKELCRFYASAGGNVDIRISGKQDSLVVDYTSPSDTINNWLQQFDLSEVFSLKPSELSQKCKGTLDSLKECGETSLRTTILLRDYMPYLLDSLYVRRYLGGISNDDKPEWLVNSIDKQYPRLRPVSEMGRLSAAQFQTHDTIVNINTSARSDYMLLYFWGDYSPSSVDSLKSLSKKIHKSYSEKRVMFISICVSAPDSAWWNTQIEGLPTGHHALLYGGFADPRISDWSVTQIPYTLITDMFTNIQNRNIWNEDLNKALDRIPKRSIHNRNMRTIN